jgi:hypothetical protein
MAPKEDGAQSHAAACQTPAGPALPYGSMEGGAWSVERGAWTASAGSARRIWEAAVRSAAQRHTAQGASRAAWASQGKRVGRGTGGVELLDRAPRRRRQQMSRGEINPCHAPAAPKATRASGRRRIKGQTARAPGPLGQR